MDAKVEHKKIKKLGIRTPRDSQIYGHPYISRKLFFYDHPYTCSSFSGDISPDSAQVPRKSYEWFSRLLWDDEIRADDWPKRVKDGVGRCGATSIGADSDKAALNRESCAFVTAAAHLLIALNEPFNVNRSSKGGLPHSGAGISAGIPNLPICTKWPMLNLGKERCAGCHWSCFLQLRMR